MIKPLISVEALVGMMSDPNLIILDASTPGNKSNLTSNYPDIQIPGSRYFDFKNDFCDLSSDIPNMLPPPGDFQNACRKLGINSTSKVVVYDNLGIYTSPRAWWMLTMMGHKDVAVLDGGLPEWVRLGNSSEPVNRAENDPNSLSGDFTAHFDNSRVKNAEDILENIAQNHSIVIDARSKGRFEGTAPEPRQDSKSGHIPNSLNLPYGKVLQDGKYLPKKDLEAEFNTLNLSEKPLIFSCGSGITACIILLAHELIADQPASVYDGSWSEWGNENANYPVDV